MKTYFGYIRVSTTKQGQLGSSLQEQRDAIERFAQKASVGITEWFEDRETAAKRGRTQFLRMMAALEKGKAHGVILHKIDRGARNLWDWARLQDLIDKGVEVHFAHDNLDLKSRGGRLAADIQAVVAADYVRNLRDEVRKGIQGRLKQGLYPRKAPVGYLDQGKAKPKIIDPAKGPLVCAAFELYATKRYSYETLSVELHRRGLRRTSGKPLSNCGIATILQNPFYVGIIRVKSTGETFQGVHDPLVPAKTFQRVQEIIAGRDNHKVRRFDFTYRRMLRCGECDGLLTGERQKGHVYYRCHIRSCPGTGIREEAVHRALETALSVLSTDGMPVSDLLPYLKVREEDNAARMVAEVAAAKLRLAALEAREQRLTDAYLDQAIDRDVYLTRRSDMLVGTIEARENLASLEAGPVAGADRVGNFFELLKALELGAIVQTPAEYRRILEILTSNLMLKGKTLVVALRSPFREAAQGMSLLSGAPDRSLVRTCTAHSTSEGSCDCPYAPPTPEQRAEVLYEALKDWTPPTELAGVSRSEKKQNPSWFKPRHPPSAST